VTTLRALLEAGGSLASTELRAKVNVNLPLLRPLIDDGILAIREGTVERDPLAGRQYEPRQAPPLTLEQRNAFEAVARALEAQRTQTFLLHGVTGSGK